MSSKLALYLGIINHFVIIPMILLHALASQPMVVNGVVITIPGISVKK